MKARLIKWLLRRLGYPTHRLVEGAPSMLAVVHNGAIVFTTSQAPHVARAKCRELRANLISHPASNAPKVVLYRAVREEPC